MTARVYPRRWTANERLSALKLNQVVDAVRDAGRQAAINAQAIDAALDADAFYRVKFKSFPPLDGGTPRPYLVCADPLVPTQVINVAKNLNLRARASHGGHTFTYSSDTTRQADGTEDQLILPAFDVDDDIIAIQVANGTGIVDIDGNPITWLDLNVDGRNWAADVTP